MHYYVMRSLCCCVLRSQLAQLETLAHSCGCLPSECNGTSDWQRLDTVMRHKSSSSAATDCSFKSAASTLSTARCCSCTQRNHHHWITGQSNSNCKPITSLCHFMHFNDWLRTACVPLLTELGSRQDDIVVASWGGTRVSCTCG